MDFREGAEYGDEVVDLAPECAVCEVGPEDVSGEGAGEGCGCAIVGGIEDGCVMVGGVGVDGEFAGGAHVEVGVDGIVF
jgi:hypothetical protein